MKRRLSSLQTIFVKFVLPGICIPALGMFPLMALFRSEEDFDLPLIGLFFLVWVGLSIFMCWESVLLKAVSVDDNYLYVSNYIKEIAVPLSDILDVTERRWLNPRQVTIHLKSPSEFGDKIVFLPTTRPFGWFSSHPVVAELKHLARSRLWR